MHATPVPFWPSQRPLVAIPGFCTPRSCQLPVATLCSSRVRRDFLWIFTTFPHVAFTLRFPNDLQTFRHYFLFALVDVVRPRAGYARHPYPSRWNRTPWPPPSCARIPLLRSLLVSLSPECRQLFSSRSRVPLPGFHLTVLRATRAR